MTGKTTTFFLKAMKTCVKMNVSCRYGSLATSIKYRRLIRCSSKFYLMTYYLGVFLLLYSSPKLKCECFLWLVSAVVWTCQYIVGKFPAYSGKRPIDPALCGYPTFSQQRAHWMGSKLRHSSPSYPRIP